MYSGDKQVGQNTTPSPKEPNNKASCLKFYGGECKQAA